MKQLSQQVRLGSTTLAALQAVESHSSGLSVDVDAADFVRSNSQPRRVAS
ncbi:MAG: hypothetical protein WB711_24380 [Terriglobales bacterium]